MDDQLEQILETLPEKPPRSRLETYREFIEELRRRGRTYRDIAAILAEKCELRVSASAIHDFVRTRSREKVMGRTGRTDAKRLPAYQSLDGEKTAFNTNAPPDVVQQRIAALRHRNAAIQPAPEGFQFDPGEPLRLKQLGRKRRDD
jgi:hypothetical protein